MLGHNGGQLASRRPASIEHLVDDLERLLDELGIAKAHLAGNSLSPAEFLSLTDDLIGCQISGDLLASDARLSPLDPAPCPITLAWSAEDRIFPLETYRSRACELIPGADVIELDDVGHIPMLDDPRLVAQTILSSAARTTDTLNG
jgi:pimeloyl-ACP methyl ester carboxylesterase